ncbi:hypothetical protein GYMLUDRAFT_86156 [Collybiopsis luxurians FD-317 M1]|uniref:F-box domain-containing protein n=1 Tax=Collybiopsis luxurians FD-317 M1 TaxID=944289 RepID=A0A0D0CK23_9AGAR|nr:hypothetical protein GYMLUDRAFT_86156 [Collybiopsis luxurians FD-317 M1]
MAVKTNSRALFQANSNEDTLVSESGGNLKGEDTVLQHGKLHYDPQKHVHSQESGGEDNLFSLVALPVEIKLEIVNYLKPEDILMLSCACRSTRDALFSTVFQKVVIRPKNADEVLLRAKSCTSRTDLYRSLDRKITNEVLLKAKACISRTDFYHSLDRDGYIPQTVLPVTRECVIKDWERLRLPDRAMDALLHAYSNSSPRMSNLTSLMLNRVPVTAPLLSNIQQLPHL